MDEKKLKAILKSALVVDVRDKIVLIVQSDDVANAVSDASMADTANCLKRAGAVEVIVTTPDVTLQSLSDEDLKGIGLCRIGTKEEEVKDGKSKSKRKSKKAEFTH